MIVLLCSTTLLLAFLCMRMTLRIKGPLWECHWAGRFWATLLLHTLAIRMRSHTLEG